MLGAAIASLGKKNERSEPEAPDVPSRTEAAPPDQRKVRA